MNRTRRNLILLILATPFALISGDVLQHHRNGTRDGLYVDPLITRATAARIGLNRVIRVGVELNGDPRRTRLPNSGGKH